MTIINDIFKANADRFIDDLQNQAKTMRGVQSSASPGDYHETVSAYLSIIEAARDAAAAKRRDIESRKPVDKVFMGSMPCQSFARKTPEPTIDELIESGHLLPLKTLSTGFRDSMSRRFRSTPVAEKRTLRDVRDDDINKLVFVKTDRFDCTPAIIRRDWLSLSIWAELQYPNGDRSRRVFSFQISEPVKPTLYDYQQNLILWLMKTDEKVWREPDDSDAGEDRLIRIKGEVRVFNGKVFPSTCPFPGMYIAQIKDGSTVRCITNFEVSE